MDRKTRLRTVNSKIDVEQNNLITGDSNIDLFASTEIQKRYIEVFKLIIHTTISQKQPELERNL